MLESKETVVSQSSFAEKGLCTTLRSRLGAMTSKSNETKVEAAAKVFGPKGVRGWSYELDVIKVKNYLTRVADAAKGPYRSSGKTRERRHVSAIVAIAAEVQRNGAKYRRLLHQLGAGSEGVLSVAAQMAELNSTVEQQMGEIKRVTDLHELHKKRTLDAREKLVESTKRLKKEQSAMVSEQVKARVAAFKTKIRDWKRATRKEERQKAIQKRDGELGEQVTLWKAKKNEQAARARAAEAIAKRVDRAEERARTAEATLKGLTYEHDELHLQAERAKEEAAEIVDQRLAAAAAARQALVQPSRPNGGRGGLQFPWKYRVICMAQLARGVPPSAIASNVSETIKFVSPELEVRVPGKDMLRSLRTELGFLGVACSAYRVADATRIRSFGFDETSKLQVSTLTANAEIETKAGTVEALTLNCAFVIPNGTAAGIVGSIENKLFVRLREYLQTVVDV